MAITSGFFNSLDGDRTYNAEQMSEYFKGIISDGVAENVGGALQVLAGSGMNVNVQTGRAYIDSRWLESDAIETLPITAAHVTLNRYTAVVVQLDMTNRQMTITTKDGTPATSPVKPSMTNTELIKELCLAYVYVGAGVTSITQTNISDTRPNNNVCGWVTGVIEQVDTSTLFAQWEAAYEEYFEESQQEFEDWFRTIKDTLATATLLTKLEYDYTTSLDKESVFTVTDYLPTYNYALDILEIRINGLTLGANEYSRTGARVTLATPITHSGTPISFCVYKSIDGSDAETVVEEVQQLLTDVANLQTQAGNTINAIADTYETGVRYEVGDIVVYNNQIYRANQLITSSGSFDSSQWNVANFGDMLADTGWIIADLETAFTPWSNDAAPRYRKIGSQVYIDGIVKPTTTISGSNDLVPMFYVDNEMKPERRQVFICQASASNTWMVSVETSGAVTFSRYSQNGSYIDAGTNVWLPFSISYAVG